MDGPSEKLNVASRENSVVGMITWGMSSSRSGNTVNATNHQGQAGSGFPERRLRSGLSPLATQKCRAPKSQRRKVVASADDHTTQKESGEKARTVLI